jgi:hypothetical protein
MKTFKNTAVLFALAFVTLFTACKKEKDVTPQTTEQKVLGKWNIAKVSETIFVNNSKFDESETPGKAGDYVEFNSNKTLVVNSDGDLKSGTYQILNENAMSFTIDGGTATVTIDKLEANQFIFTSSISYTYEGANVREVYKYELSK